MHLVRTGAPLGDRVILASNSDIALAEPLDGELAAVDAVRETVFDEDPDDRPPLVEPPEWRAVILDVPTGELLGSVIWRPIPYGGRRSATAWNIRIHPVPTARGRSAVAGRLLAEHLLRTTEVDRVETDLDVENRPDQRGLETAGFRPEGILRGLQLRDGQRRDMVRYSLLRTDLEVSDEGAGERAILAHRDGIVLAEALPTDRDAVSAALPKPERSITRCFLASPSSVCCTVRSSRSSTGSRLLFWLHALVSEFVAVSNLRKC